METPNILTTFPARNNDGRFPGVERDTFTEFQSILEDKSCEHRAQAPYSRARFPELGHDLFPDSAGNFRLRPDALAACKNNFSQKQHLASIPETHPIPPMNARIQYKGDTANAYPVRNPEAEQMSGWEKYKDDQLLSNPGGDHYYLGQGKGDTRPNDTNSFSGRIGKDISDALANVKNFFQNFAYGSKIKYRDENNRIQEARQRGILGSVIDFFKDMGSAFSFGEWRPDGEEEPLGLGKRAVFFFSKMKEAIFGDLVQGIPGSVIHMGEDLILAGWNLIEVIPDATIGNFQVGREMTTTIFDNGQVVIDYLTDIIPTGEAWLRVHAMNVTDSSKPKAPPILYNLKMPERYRGDLRWPLVRNTPFRKTIETIGALVADFATLKILSQAKLLSDEDHRQDLQNEKKDTAPPRRFTEDSRLPTVEEVECCEPPIFEDSVASLP